jgi:putative transposase
VPKPFVKGKTAVARNYHTLRAGRAASEKQLNTFLMKNGQQLLPMVQLIEQSRVAIDELVDTIGRVTIDTILEMSAEQVAGPRQQGQWRRDQDLVWYGKQPGQIYLSDRKLTVNKPRLRRRGVGAEKEVPIPAYVALRDRVGLQRRMLELLMNGVSTRSYRQVIPQMADSVGISKSTVSQQTIAAAEQALAELLARRLEDKDILVVYIDGLHFGEYCVIGAVGVDVEGQKTVLGIHQGATENAGACKDLLEDLVARGLDPKRKRLFVIDGSKALRSAINAVFGSHTPVQRCRQHKLRNVLERLPKEQQPQTGALIKAAWKMDAKAGMAKLRKMAEWLEHEYPDAAASLLEGMEECFTINRLEVPHSLHRCLASTNLIESSQSGVRMRTRRVCRWRADMPARWAAAAFLETEQHFNRVMGYRDLWALKAILDGEQVKTKKEIA